MTRASPLADFPAITALKPAGWTPGQLLPPLPAPRLLPGESLRLLRRRRGLTTRKVAEWSRTIAQDRGSAEFSLSHARLVQLENGRTPPSLQKAFTLSVIYGLTLHDLLGIYLNFD